MHIYMSEWRRRLLPVGLFACAAILLSCAMATFFAPASYAANANFSGDTLNLNGSEFTRTDIPCGSNKGEPAETDIRNWAGDPDCSGDITYYKNDAGGGSCDSYIAIRGDPRKATSANYLKREAQGVTLSCRVERGESITLNDGKSAEQAEKERARQQLKDKRRQNLEANADSICREADPDNRQECKRKILTAFDQCYGELGGAGGVARDIGNTEAEGDRQIRDCISRKTGYSSDDLQFAFIPSLSSNTTKECEVQGLGWMVCQAGKLLAAITDGIFAALSSLMETPPLSRGSPGGDEIFKAWSSIRNVANVLFIILFIIVIISYVTSIGIDNYTIKKIVPRIVVAAILINSSYYICALVVDVSNVLGASLKEVLSAMAGPVRPDFDGWGHVTSALLVGGSALLLYAGIFSLGPILISGLFAMFVTVLILLARQAFLIILIVISPIAFALNMLPGTQKWFSKWWSAFILLAMVFPVIGLVYGGSRVAAGVISASAPQEAGLVTVIFAVLSLGVLTIPFFIVPLALKFGGGLLNRFGGIVNDRGKGLVDRAKNRAAQAGENAQNQRTTRALFADTSKKRSRYNPYGAYARRKNLRDYKVKYHESQLKRGDGTALDSYLADDDVINKVAEKGAQAAGQARVEAIRTALQNTQIQLDTSDLEANEAVLADSNTSLSELRTMASNQDGTYTDSEKAAAIRMLSAKGNIDDIHQLIDEMGSMTSLQRQALASGIDKSGVSKNAAHLGTSATNMIRSSGTGPAPSLDQFYQTAYQEGRYSPAGMASQHSQAAAGLRSWAGRAGGDVATSLHDSAQAATSNPKLRTNASNATLRELDQF